MQNDPWNTVANFQSSQQPTSPSSDPWDAVASLNGQATPSDVANAQSDTGDQNYNDMCQKFVEQMAYGKTGLFPTAQDAWDHYVQDGKAQQGDVAKAPAGTLVYFKADQSNSDFGHVAIADGKGNIIGATDNGVQQMPVDNWIKQTGQVPLGYVKP